METVSVTAQTPAQAARVWAILADFGAFLDWAYRGSGGSIKVEGDGIGMVRHLDLGGSKVAERLDRLDREDRTLSYSLAYGEPLGMTEYRAHVRVEEQEEGRCILHWIGEFTTGDPEKTAEIIATLEGVYDAFSKALAVYANETTG
jgi:hypothetical protein